MSANKPANDPQTTKSYRVGGRITILQIMLVVGILGLVLTWVVDRFF